jgi:hypothetical protein
LGDDEGLAEVGEVGGVFAEDGLAVEDMAIATGGPVSVGIVREAFPEGIGSVACDEALEVAGFVAEGGEKVVVAVGEAVGGGAVGGVG